MNECLMTIDQRRWSWPSNFLCCIMLQVTASTIQRLYLQSDVDFNLLLGSNDKEHDRGSLKESTGNESDALLGRLIRRLTAVIVTHLPSFWRLAISIFNGKFAKVMTSLHKSSRVGVNNG